MTAPSSSRRNYQRAIAVAAAGNVEWRDPVPGFLGSLDALIEDIISEEATIVRDVPPVKNLQAKAPPARALPKRPLPARAAGLPPMKSEAAVTPKGADEDRTDLDLHTSLDAMSDLKALSRHKQEALEQEPSSSKSAVRSKTSQASYVAVRTKSDETRLAPVKARVPEARRSRPEILARAVAAELGSVSKKLDTALLSISPALMAALKKMAPKKRRSAVPFVLFGTIMILVGVLAADASIREFALSQISRFY